VNGRVDREDFFPGKTAMHFIRITTQKSITAKAKTMCVWLHLLRVNAVFILRYLTVMPGRNSGMSGFKQFLFKQKAHLFRQALFHRIWV
jgi:hypothetical protein